MALGLAYLFAQFMFHEFFSTNSSIHGAKRIVQQASILTEKIKD